MTSKRDDFTNLLQSHVRIIYKIVNSYCKKEHAKKDLEQEIVLQLWASFERYDQQYKFSTWMYRVALNTAISFYRKNLKQKERYYDRDYTSIISIEDEESVSEKEAQLNLLQQFINDLDPLNKAIMLLYLDEKSHQEIADIIGISKSNVGTKIGRIKIKLKSEFKKHLQ